MEMNFCRRCSEKLTNVAGHVYKCETGHTLYANCSPSVGIFFLTPNNEVLFSVRGIEPHKGMLDAFGGFLDGEETVESAVRREIKEELGLDPTDYETVNFLCSGIGHYPYAGEVLPVVSLLFWSRLLPSAAPTPADDVAAIKTVKLHKVDFAKLHDTDIKIGIRALQTLFPDK